MNCIVTCLDTLRWDALGYANPDWVRTPCIDRFAESATDLTSAYCASFPTVPMRVDAYTGDVNWPRYGWKGLDEGQPALPAILGEHGVYTGLVLDLCGVPNPYPTVGKSWKPLLLGESTRRHDHIYTTCHSGGGPGTIRHLGSHITVTTPTHTAIVGPPPRTPELYDRRTDSEQLTNIAANAPGLVDALHRGLRSFMQRQGASATYVSAYAGREN